MTRCGPGLGLPVGVVWCELGPPGWAPLGREIHCMVHKHDHWSCLNDNFNKWVIIEARHQLWVHIPTVAVLSFSLHSLQIINDFLHPFKSTGFEILESR